MSMHQKTMPVAPTGQLQELIGRSVGPVLACIRPAPVIERRCPRCCPPPPQHVHHHGCCEQHHGHHDHGHHDHGCGCS